MSPALLCPAFLKLYVERIGAIPFRRRFFCKYVQSLYSTVLVLRFKLNKSPVYDRLQGNESLVFGR
jgi:hypothetical protein